MKASPTLSKDGADGERCVCITGLGWFQRSMVDGAVWFQAVMRRGHGDGEEDLISTPDERVNCQIRDGYSFIHI